jgi:ketol-acid reductoisomerase
VRGLKLTYCTSQYGQLKTSQELDVSWMRNHFKHVAEERILGGAFSREFTEAEQKPGGIDGALKKLYQEAEKTELAVGEKRVRERLGLKT